MATCNLSWGQFRWTKNNNNKWWASDVGRWTKTKFYTEVVRPNDTSIWTPTHIRACFRYDNSFTASEENLGQEWQDSMQNLEAWTTAHTRGFQIWWSRMFAVHRIRIIKMSLSNQLYQITESIIQKRQHVQGERVIK